MEFETSDKGQKVSPSQDTICLLEPAKRDIESMGDFEDLTKEDISSVKDITTQFLQNETNERNPQRSDESLPSFGENFDAKTNNSEQLLSDWTQTSSGPKVAIDKDEPGFDPFSYGEQNFVDNVQSHNNESSDKLLHQDETSRNFINFEKDDVVYCNEEDDLIIQSHSQEDIEKEKLDDFVENNKVIAVPSNDGIYSASDDLPFTPKKGESSPVLHSGFEKDNSGKVILECKSDEGTDMCSNPSRVSCAPAKAREHETQRTQGDGFHIKESDDGDLSDCDDIAPEPIPKDYPEIGAIEGKQFLAAIGLDTWFHPDLLNPKVESLVYWRDPKKSGVVFGTVMVILLSLTTFSLISVVAYTSLTVLAAAVGFRVYKNVLQAVQKTSEGHPFKTYLLPVLTHRTVSDVFMSVKEYLDFDLTLNPDRAREISDVVVSYLNWAVSRCRSLFLVEDLIDSIKFGICLWCLTYVGAWFNGLSLIIIAFVGLFTLPKVYENNKTQIDANLDIVRSKINEVTDKIRAVSPIGKKSEEGKDKSE